MLVLTAIAAGVASAQPGGITREMQYYGVRTDSDGNPLQGEHDIAFSIWAEASGGSTIR
jgi:hypothetical protein